MVRHAEICCDAQDLTASWQKNIGPDVGPGANVRGEQSGHLGSQFRKNRFHGCFGRH